MWYLGGSKHSKKSTFKFVPFCTGSVAFLATSAVCVSHHVPAAFIKAKLSAVQVKGVVI